MAGTPCGLGAGHYRRPKRLLRPRRWGVGGGWADQPPAASTSSIEAGEQFLTCTCRPCARVCTCTGACSAGPPGGPPGALAGGGARIATTPTADSVPSGPAEPMARVLAPTGNWARLALGVTTVKPAVLASATVPLTMTMPGGGCGCCCAGLATTTKNAAIVPSEL